MKNKTLLWVGIASALLIGGGLWWMKKKPKTDDTKDDTKTDDTKKEESKPADTTPKNTPASPATTPASPATPLKDATASSKSGFVAGNKLYIKRSVANVYSYPNLMGKNRIGYIQQSATSQATFKGDANTKGWVVAVAKYISIRDKKEVVGNVYIQTNDVTNLAP